MLDISSIGHIGMAVPILEIKAQRTKPMNIMSTTRFPTANGYMTEKTRTNYIASAINSGVLPTNAHQMPQIISLSAPKDSTSPIQFWQLFSILGPDPIVAIVGDFYQRVFAQEDWFKSVFTRVGGLQHHVNTQASMWADVMGGGRFYHGAEFRLNFHHTHNAYQLMNEHGAKLWVALMVQALDATETTTTQDPRIRRSLNTFLTHFMGKYAKDFAFENHETFGETNAPWRPKVNFMNMTANAIEAMSEGDLKQGLEGRGIDIGPFHDKAELVRKAQSL